MAIQRLCRCLSLILGQSISRQSATSFVFLALIIMGLPTFASAQQTCQPNGDVDRNGSVTAADALLAFQQALSLIELDTCQLSIADVYPQPVTPDGNVTASDALCIFQKALRLPSCLPDAPSSNQLPNELAKVSQVETISLEGGETITVAKNEVLFYLDGDISRQDYEAILSRIVELGGQIIGRLEDMGTLQVKVQDDMDESEFAESLKGYSGVVGAGFNLMREVSDRIDDERSEEAITYPDFLGDYWIDQIGANRVWEHMEDSASSEAVIGILDSGFPAVPAWHTGSISSDRLIRYNTAGIAIIHNRDSLGNALGYRHGAYVACMAAADIGSGRGVAWKNHVVSVDVVGPGRISNTDIYQGMKVAVQNGVNIVNVSLNPTRAKNAEVIIADRLGWIAPVLYAAQNDVLVVFSAGNSGIKNDNRLFKSIGLPGIFYITDQRLAHAADAWSTHVLIVAAVDIFNTEALFSVMGDVVNIAAPGVNVGCGLEDFTVQGAIYGIDSGTSYAAPLVTGTAALMKSVSPQLTAPEIRSLILETASANVNLIPGSNHPDIQLNTCEAVRAAAPIALADNIDCGCDMELWPHTTNTPYVMCLADPPPDGPCYSLGNYEGSEESTFIGWLEPEGLGVVMFEYEVKSTCPFGFSGRNYTYAICAVCAASGRYLGGVSQGLILADTLLPPCSEFPACEHQKLHDLGIPHDSEKFVYRNFTCSEVYDNDSLNDSLGDFMVIDDICTLAENY